MASGRKEIGTYPLSPCFQALARHSGICPRCLENKLAPESVSNFNWG